jgi:hypothetical protein
MGLTNRTRHNLGFVGYGAKCAASCLSLPGAITERLGITTF